MSAPPDPAIFGWEKLGLPLAGSAAIGDPGADFNAVLGREHPHWQTDEARVLSQIAAIREKRDKIGTPASWAAKNAKFAGGHAVAASGDGLGEGEHTLLTAACARVRKPPAQMRGMRLGDNMYAVLKQDSPALLVSNVRPARPDLLELKRCGEYPFHECMRDLLLDPPSCAFAVLRFGKASYTWEQIAINLSPRRIRVPTGTVNRDRVLAARDAATGVEWRLLEELASLAERRELSVGSTAGMKAVDAGIEKAAGKLPAGMDVHDLMATLPARGSADWQALGWLIPRTEAKPGSARGAGTEAAAQEESAAG